MWDWAGSGMEAVSLAWAGRFFATESPGMPPRGWFKFWLANRSKGPPEIYYCWLSWAHWQTGRMDSDLEHVFCDWLLMSAMGTNFCVCVCVCVCLPLPTVYIWESRSLRSQSVVLVPWQRQSERNPISCERRGGPWVHRFCEFRVILVKFLAFPQQSKCGALQLWWRSWQAAWSTLPLAHQMAENLSWQRLGFKNGSWPRAFKMGWGELFALVPLGASASPHNGVMGTTWSRKQNCWSCDQS